jgi:hypothetical protein
VSKKPRKVAEPQAPYARKKPVKKAAASESKPVRYADPAQARKSMEKVFRVHQELLRKLAQ